MVGLALTVIQSWANAGSKVDLPEGIQHAVVVEFVDIQQNRLSMPSLPLSKNFSNAVPDCLVHSTIGTLLSPFPSRKVETEKN
jgi:hypothetical protein